MAAQVKWCNPLTLQPEQSGGHGLIPGRALLFEGEIAFFSVKHLDHRNRADLISNLLPLVMKKLKWGWRVVPGIKHIQWRRHGGAGGNSSPQFSKVGKNFQ